MRRTGDRAIAWGHVGDVGWMHCVFLLSGRPLCHLERNVRRMREKTRHRQSHKSIGGSKSAVLYSEQSVGKLC